MPVCLVFTVIETTFTDGNAGVALEPLPEFFDIFIGVLSGEVGV
jgi:hypothetical protein